MTQPKEVLKPAEFGYSLAIRSGTADRMPRGR